MTISQILFTVFPPTETICVCRSVCWQVDGRTGFLPLQYNLSNNLLLHSFMSFMSGMKCGLDFYEVRIRFLHTLLHRTCILHIWPQFFEFLLPWKEYVQPLGGSALMSTCIDFTLFSLGCVLHTSLGMCPWYQPWLRMSAGLSLSSSSSSLRSFSGGDSSRYFSFENCVEQTSRKGIRIKWSTAYSPRNLLHKRLNITLTYSETVNPKEIKNSLADLTTWK